MKIAFAIKALGNPGGGAERVLVQIASALAARGHSVTVITSDAVGVSPFYQLSDDVNWIQLGIGDVSGRSRMFDFWRRVLAMRRTLLELRPNVVVAFMHSTYVPVALAMLGSSIPVIASEHTIRDHFGNHSVQRMLLYLAPILCVQTTVVSSQARQSFGAWLSRRMVVMPNPVSVLLVSKASRSSESAKANRTLLTVGRLSPEKGQAELVSAFSSIHTHFPDWKLRIVGEGESRGALESQIESLDLAASIKLVGASTNVDAEYAEADLFVLPSHYESFGMATAEALMHGLPVVGFSDCWGNNELIQDGINGRLIYGADRINALAGVLAELMHDSSERQKLSNSSREWLHEKYGICGVVRHWESLLANVIENVAGN